MAEPAATAAAQAALDELNAALSTRDRHFLERFHKEAIFIGSEPGEFARGRDELAKLLETIFRSPSSVQFDWASVEAASAGDTVWFHADGAVVLVSPAGERRRPYTLTGVLRNGQQGWRWRLFHGSEPWIEPPASH